MTRKPLVEVMEKVIRRAANSAEKSGFVRKGSVLRIFTNGNSGIIEFQKSVRNSGDRTLFTINLAVVCGALLEPEQPPLERARSFDAHLRQRIGMLLPGRPDKWWEITDATDADALAAEIGDLISNEGVPYVSRYLDVNEVIALWESGMSPGLTQTQRVKYLEKLSAKRQA
jgi:hypothetical protein